jgi:hypothetical protein
LLLSTKNIYAALGASLLVALPLACATSATAAPADTASHHVTRPPRSTVPHQDAAEELIDHLNAIGWPKETHYNRYQTGSEKTEVRWGHRGHPTTYKNVSKCASFVTEILKHTYPNWATPSFFEIHFHKRSPFARDYYEVISDTDKPVPHFKVIAKVADLRPGDIIVIKYPTPERATGHIMLVRSIKNSYTGGPPLDGATQYKVEIIDTTESAHGDSDTRTTPSKKETGAGYGQMQFYADRNGMFAGYRWSLSSDQIIPVNTHPIIAARITH